MRDMVSIVVPVYNVEKYLKKCVNSIIIQTYKNLEIILVDDGSPDRSGALCDRLAEKDSRIRVIHKKNGGVSSARNAGIEVATGEYICFVDSDDWLAADAIKTLLSRIQSDGSDFCVGAAKTVGIRESSPWQLPDACIETGNIHEILPFEYALKAPWAKLFRTEIIQQNGLKFLPDIAFGEDTIFVWSYLGYCNRISMLDSAVYFYSLLNLTNASGKYYRDLADWQYLYIEALESAIDRCALSTQKKRQLVCQMVAKGIFYWGMVYSQHLILNNREELLERLRYTVNLFRDYLFDDLLECGVGMEKEQEMLKAYVLPEDYNGLADYYLDTIQKRKKNVIERAVREIALCCKRNWTYCRYR